VSHPDRYQFEPLGKHHNRAAFSCGAPELDAYLQRQARQDQDRGATHCYVLLDLVEDRIVGYYTLSATSIAAHDLPDEQAGRLPRYPNLPGILLGRLAVDERYRRQGFGRHLLVHALIQVREVRRRIGTVAVVVDAKDEAAAAFYRAHDFIPFRDDPRRLFLPIAMVESL
jgi:GNAT superfamily N-acetyltransferase